MNIANIRYEDKLQVLYKKINKSSTFFLYIVLMIAAGLFLLMRPAIQVGIADGGTFVTMARSLLYGKGLTLIYLAGQPIYPVVPVGYPLILAILIYIFPTSLLPLQLLSMVLMLLTITLVYLYWRYQSGKIFALGIAALFATNIAIVQSATMIMSEALFLFCLMIALLQTERFVRLQSIRWYEVLLTAITIALPLSIRYLGLPVTITLGLYMLWHRRDKIALGTIGLSMVVFVFINLGGGGLEVAYYYFGRISGMLDRLVPQFATATATATSAATNGDSALVRLINNTQFLLTDPIPWTVVPLFHGPRIQEFFAGLGLGFAPIVLQLSIDLLLVIGFIQQIRRHARPGEWIVFAYAITLFMLPLNWETLLSKYRYWITIIPFGYAYFLIAIQSLGQSIASIIRYPKPSGLSIGLVTSAAVFLLTLNLGRNIQEAVLSPLRSRTPDFRLGTEWLQMHASADSVIMVNRPQAMALYLTHDLVREPDTHWESRILYGNLSEYQQDPYSSSTFLKVVNTFGVDYVLVTPAQVQPMHWSEYVERTLLPTVEANPNKFQLIWANEEQYTRVYQVLSGNIGSNGK